MRWIRVACYIVAPVLAFTIASYVTMSVLLRRGEDIICPDVRGKTVEAARQLVANKGLSLVIVRYERRSDVPYNHVTVQKPEANMPTRLGRVVSVIVSEGPPLVQVPSVLGLTPEEAEEAMKGKGVRVERKAVVPGFRPGRVLAQAPRAGEQVIEGRGVTLFVGSEEPGYYRMPALKDLDVDTLTRELEERGIKYRMVFERGGSPAGIQTVRTSVPSGRFFRASEEIEIKVVTGGRYE